MAKKIVGVEIGIAPVPKHPAAHDEHGVRFSLRKEFCREVVAFHVGGLPVQNDNPFYVLEFVVVDQPLTALGEDDVKRDDGEDNRRYSDDACLLD